LALRRTRRLRMLQLGQPDHMTSGLSRLKLIGRGP
jgi:hypothetical protein